MKKIFAQKKRKRRTGETSVARLYLTGEISKREATANNMPGQKNQKVRVKDSQELSAKTKPRRTCRNEKLEKKKGGREAGTTGVTKQVPEGKAQGTHHQEGPLQQKPTGEENYPG